VIKKFKSLGVMKCKPCALKWKKSIKAHGKKCRVVKNKQGYEVYRGD
jgi:16S rRNA G1207 methylase RsmC